VLQEPAEPLLAHDFTRREQEIWRRINSDVSQGPVADALMGPRACSN
jgi:hypothetical protein